MAGATDCRGISVGTAPIYLICDNDGVYGQIFTARLRAIGIQDRPISPKSPWQNAYVERLIGTLRRELSGSCADLWRAEFTAGSNRVLDLLQRDAHASWIEQGRAPTAGLSSDLGL
jgi:transposase InsO family protein